MRSIACGLVMLALILPGAGGAETLGVRRSEFTPVTPSPMVLASSPAATDGREAKVETPNIIKPADQESRKYRLTGFLYAAVPGFVLHGNGHYYAENNLTAGTLLVSEIVGLVMMWWKHDPWKSDPWIADVGVVLFAGSWLYDMVRTPAEVERWNVEHGFGTARRSPLDVGRDVFQTITGLSLPEPEPKPAPASLPPPASNLTVAVANFAAEGISAGDATVISDWVRSELVKTGAARVVERSQMDRITAEQAFQQTGCTTDDCAVRLGRLLNAQRLIVGRFSSFLKEYVVTAGVVNVETGEVVATDHARGRNADEIIAAAKEMTARLAKGIH